MMTDQELIDECDAKAKAIMHDKSHFGDPNARANQLEAAIKYHVCAAILSGEVSYASLAQLLQRLKP